MASLRADTSDDFTKYEAMAEKGDTRAMITIGLYYHQGNGGVSKDYEKAMDWYLKAYAKWNGDAFNNIGVMYRDGLGVPKSKKVAYLLFLIVHMEGLGDDATQIRAGRNLSQLAEELSESDHKEALSYTFPYVDQIVKSRSQNMKIGKGVLPSKENIRFKDNGWWLDSERKGLQFDPPAPWN
ncbi:sel1 repeat family protein [Luteolibacter pohnpeiensis]|uniref:Sel1 repeat family protein n=1 Tax=Luteolibacter pohnpeiensis TaxID=454153 RepID=A0A934SE69_9BACT|nr:tetratricopeptide repeat protein [Luteolibacter pohnpeiensis]MBK1884244.1 sel1 repeat family protein [Luteolibacter pohnpeiensis]